MLNICKSSILFLFVASVVLSGCTKKPNGETISLSSPVNTEMTEAEAAVPTTAEPSAATTGAVDINELKTVYFGYDSSTLTEEAHQILASNASWLISNTGVSVSIEGHCDERGSDEYNFALGENRALAVKKYLIALGVAPDRLKTISFGEERPAVIDHNETAWSKNRRSEFKLI